MQTLPKPRSLQMHCLRSTPLPTTHQTTNHLPNTHNQNHTDKHHNHQSNNKQRKKPNPRTHQTVLGRARATHLQQNLHHNKTPNIHSQNQTNHHRIHLLHTNKKRYTNSGIRHTTTTPKHRHRQTPNQKNRNRSQTPKKEKTARLNFQRRFTRTSILPTPRLPNHPSKTQRNSRKTQFSFKGNRWTASKRRAKIAETPQMMPYSRLISSNVSLAFEYPANSLDSFSHG